MDTALRPPAPPAADALSDRAGGPAPRRHRIGWALLFLTLLFAAAIAWIANLQPLAPGSVGFGAEGSRSGSSPGVEIREQRVRAFGVEGTVLRVPEAAAPFTYTFTLRNDGPLPIRIVHVGTAPPTSSLRRELDAVDPDLWDDRMVGDNFGPFQPFTIEPGGEAGFRMRVSVGRLDEGSTIGWYTEHVTFRVLGIVERHAFVDTGVQIEVVGQGPSMVR